MDSKPVLIIGAGPAGLATALQLKRQGIEALLLEGGQVGGLLHNANLVENYPGFPGGLPGPQLVALFAQQAQDIGVDVISEEVLALHYENGHFRVETSDNGYLARIAAVATGTKPKMFTDITIPENLLARIFYEVYPLLGMEGKRIAIVGAGDAAFDYALNLSKANQVLILNRGEAISCLPLLKERAQAIASIEYFDWTHIQALKESPRGMIRLACESHGKEKEFEVDYIIGAIGREPRLDFVADSIFERVGELQDDGLLYFVGDVKNGRYRQTAIAAGDGIRAAMEIGLRLRELTKEHSI